MSNPEPASAPSVDRAFRKGIEDNPDKAANAQSGLGSLTAEQALALLDIQVRSRHLDFAALQLRGRGRGYYTIGSSGHEGNAAVAAAMRPDDPAFLHYRSGGFFLERARQGGYPHAVRDILLGMVAARDEPIAGGRHKVFGSRPLWVPPQTSTVASQLPKAVGMAFALKRANRLGVSTDLPGDAIVMCSFGDASANHSTATGAINAACYIAHMDLPMPLLFVCEDNGLGISVRTPPGWIEQNYRGRPGLRYFSADGCRLASAYEVASDAVRYVRETRKPAFLHLSTVRLLGHAGSDVALAYRDIEDLRSDEARDPVLATARMLVEAGVITPAEAQARYEAAQAEVEATVRAVEGRPMLSTAAEVMTPLAPRHPAKIDTEAARVVAEPARLQFWAPSVIDDEAARQQQRRRLPEHAGALPLAGHINRCLGDLMLKYPELMIFGEDVAKKGGVYGLTRGLQRRMGIGRVFDTLLDEQTILGLAIGAAQAGFLPIPEIQYLAYLHNAEDQIRGEAATLQFFSQAQYQNPMVVRIASYGYQKGFGGHFHNDNSIAVLRDIPGLIVASPSNGEDAAAMLRTCVAAAKVDGAVSVMLEPIALYNTRDLHEEGDGLYQSTYQHDAPSIPLGQARRYGEGNDLLLVSFANGVRMSRRVAKRLAAQGVDASVLDLRWLAPLPIDDLLREANAVGRVLVVDETRRSGGVSEGVIAQLVDAGFEGTLRRVTSLDSFIPLGPAADLVLLGEDDIERAALAMCGRAAP
ncbi:MAG: MFS transporter [Deltaproteobacteria bacterium]|nr:MFS transporter [Deltaproteobacteria bacterium]